MNLLLYALIYVYNLFYNKNRTDHKLLNGSVDNYFAWIYLHLIPFQFPKIKRLKFVL